MKKAILVLITLFVISICILSGCASKQLNPGEKIPVEKSMKKTPDWLKTDKVTYIKDGFIYYRFLLTDAHSLDGGRRDATKIGMNTFSSSIIEKMTSEYDYARVDDTKDTKDAFIALNKTKLRGAQTQREYWVKNKIIPYPGGMLEYKYDISVLLRISIADYRATIDDALAEFDKKETSNEAKDFFKEYKNDLEDGTFEKLYNQ